MKYLNNIALMAAAVPAAMAQGLVGSKWSTSESPQNGMTDITFPISLYSASHARGYYFAQQFRFQGGDKVGYIGLQPRADSNGYPQIHAAFSVFIGGSTTDDSQCSQGADSGAGISCSVDFGDSYSDTYNMKVENVGGTTWKGTAVNTVTGTEHHIGQYTLPDGYGGIANGQQSFVEYYPWNSQTSHTCSSLPATTVYFYPPTTNTGGSGSLAAPFEYGDCAGSAGYSSSASDNGYKISVGF